MYIYMYNPLMLLIDIIVHNFAMKSLGKILLSVCYSGINVADQHYFQTNCQLQYNYT